MTHDHDHEQLTRRDAMKSAAAAAALAVLPAGAAADEDDEHPGALFEDPTIRQRVGYGTAFASGLLTNVRAQLPTLREEQEESVDTHVEETVEEFEYHTGEWLEYVNGRDLAAEDRQSLEIRFDYRGELRTRYVIAEYDADEEEYESITVETDHSDEPDVTALLQGNAVENAADELAILHEEFIEPDKDVEEAYISRLAGRYYLGSSTHISASFLGGD